jgi:hypothetical protein
VCNKIVGHMLNMHLSEAFESWRDHTKQMLRGENIVVRVLRHWTQRTSAAAFETLLKWSRKMRRAGNICRTMVWHWTKRAVSSAFTTWSDDVRKARCGKSIIARVLKNWTHHACVEVLNTWRRFLTERLLQRLPHLIQMGIQGARAPDRARHNRKRGTRSMSEPRELLAHITHSQRYWQMAEDECNVARQWYEEMASLYDHLCTQVCCDICQRHMSASGFEFDVRR